MALKVAKKGLQNAETVSENNKRKGRSSKRKGASFERVLAKKFQEQYGEELTRTPQSGGFAKKSKTAEEFRGDIVALDETIDFKLHVEAKNHKSWSLPTWLAQAEGDAPEGKVPCVVFHKDGTSKDYVTLSLADFFRLVPKERIFVKVAKKK